MVGKRIGFGREAMTPHNLPMTMIGASLLWVGWFGFNAGSALEAGNSATLAFINTFLATACAVLSWTFGEWMIKGKPSMLGAASGAVAGLVAITPAAGNVGIMGAFVIGLSAGIVCLWGVNQLKRMLGADDSLDVFGVHAVGGILGALLTGVFCSPALGGPGFVSDWVTGRRHHRRRILDRRTGADAGESGRRDDHLDRGRGVGRLHHRQHGRGLARHRRRGARRPRRQRRTARRPTTREVPGARAAANGRLRAPVFLAV